MLLGNCKQTERQFPKLQENSLHGSMVQCDQAKIKRRIKCTWVQALELASQRDPNMGSWYPVWGVLKQIAATLLHSAS